MPRRLLDRTFAFNHPHALLCLSLFLFVSGCVSPGFITTLPEEGAVPSLPPPITVHFIDVGQGDAIFIDTNGEDVLIDSGRRSAGSNVAQYIAQVSDPTVEILMASNHDADHMGGLITVMDTLNVLTVWDSGSVKETQVFAEFVMRAKVRNAILVERGQVYQLDPMTKVTILNPTQPLEFSKENDNSIVLKMEVGEVSFLFTGDCEIRCEQSILTSGFDISANFLKVGHHGSRTSSSPPFIAQIRPQYGIIQVGAGNQYGHPHPETLFTLSTHQVEIVRTDQHGTIVVTTDGKGISIKTEK